MNNMNRMNPFEGILTEFWRLKVHGQTYQDCSELEQELLIEVFEKNFEFLSDALFVCFGHDFFNKVEFSTERENYLMIEAETTQGIDSDEWASVEAYIMHSNALMLRSDIELSLRLRGYDQIERFKKLFEGHLALFESTFVGLNLELVVDICEIKKNIGVFRALTTFFSEQKLTSGLWIRFESQRHSKNKLESVFLLFCVLMYTLNLKKINIDKFLLRINKAKVWRK